VKRRLLALGLSLLFGLLPLAAGAPHRLEARGDHGWMKFWGQGKVHLEGKGTLLVKNASNLQMDIRGTWGEKFDLMDGAEYRHFEGSVDCIGPGAHLEMRGWNLRLTVVGKGKAHFRGEGTVRLDDGPERPWTSHPDKWTKVKFRD